MSRRRVKEMLRQEYNRNKNKDFSNDNDGEDEVSLASMLKKQSEKKEVIEIPSVTTIDPIKTIDLTPTIENNVTSFLDNLDKPIEKITTPRKSQKEETNSIDEELKQLEKTNTKHNSESEDSESNSSESDSESDSESNSSESDSESSEDEYEIKKREERRREERRREERKYDKKDDKKEERRRDEERRRRDEERRKEEERRRDEERRKIDDRKKDERKHKKDDNKGYSEDAVGKDDRRRYDDEPRQRSRPRHVRERSKERRSIIDNSFKNVSQKVLLKMLKREDIDSVSSNIYDAIVDVMYKFTEAIVLELAEEVKIITTNHIELIMEFYIEDEDKELPKNTIMDTEEFKEAIINIVTKHSIGIRSNAVYSLQLFIECIMGKIIKGAGIVARSSKRARSTGDDLYTAFEIYML